MRKNLTEAETDIENARRAALTPEEGEAEYLKEHNLTKAELTLLQEQDSRYVAWLASRYSPAKKAKADEVERIQNLREAEELKGNDVTHLHDAFWDAAFIFLNHED